MFDEPIQVECYAGAMADEIPRVVTQEGRRREVIEVVQQWIEEPLDREGGRRRCYRLRFHDGTEATIYRHLGKDRWFLRRGGAPGAGGAPGPPGG